MTRLSIAGAMLALSTACAATPFSAGAQVAGPVIETPTIQQETTLSLTGSGEVSVAPDIASISLGVSVDAETASAAMKQQAAQMTGVFNALKKAGIAAKNMQTGNISLNPRYDYSSRNNSPPKLIGYNASNTVNIIVRDLDKLGPTLDAVVDAGGNTVNSVSFSLDDSAEAQAEAQKLAVQDALAKAELYAAAAGVKVKRIITMNEAGGYYPQPMPMKAMRAEASDASFTPVAAGEVNYSASMNVVFELTQ